MNNLSKFIDDNNLTREEAAEVLGVSVKTIYNNLTGELSGSLEREIRRAISDIKQAKASRLAAELNELLCSKN